MEFSINPVIWPEIGVVLLFCFVYLFVCLRHVPLFFSLKVRFFLVYIIDANWIGCYFLSL